ncbi:vesicle transport through interaction with t-SNAREs 1 [Entomortierella parvispora]|uniref:Vesicle transport through interaction with t-SNAREs 1 n=1 Tax=Entomortierella parvispora TaxID=205924 RepID=A0A9P3LWE1_9FUNG|nr:vesicle transport through interaction with t-SNAREs 1 [Entomortierella parvispora]
MDSPGGSELFESYEQDFEAIKVSLHERLNASGSQTGEVKKQTLRATDREIDEANEILQQMEMELLNLPQGSRTRLQARLRGYKTELDRIKQTLKRAQSTSRSTADRDELLGGIGGGIDLDAASMDQRTRLLNGTDRLADSSRRLQDSHKVALETESLGAGILSDLRGQREQIIHTRNTLLEADSSIDKASRTLKGMARRMATNKMITASIIIVLVFLILFVLYRKIFA